MAIHPKPLVKHPVINFRHSSSEVEEALSEHYLSVQASDIEAPTLQRFVPSEALKVEQVELLPDKAEQLILFGTQPFPFVLHPLRNNLHSSLVVEVVLSVHSLILQYEGCELEAPASDQHFKLFPEYDWH